MERRRFRARRHRRRRPRRRATRSRAPSSDQAREAIADADAVALRGRRPRRAAARRRRGRRHPAPRRRARWSSSRTRSTRPATSRSPPSSTGSGLGEPHRRSRRRTATAPATSSTACVGAPAAQPETRRGGGRRTPVSASRSSGGPTSASPRSSTASSAAERVIVSEMAGTTRDSIDTELEFDGRRGRPGRHRRAAAPHARSPAPSTTTPSSAPSAPPSAPTSRSSSATRAEGVTAEDLRVAELAMKSGCATVIALNKWDLAEVEGDSTSRTRRRGVAKRVRQRPPVIAASAKTRPRRREAAREAIELADRRAERIPTPELNRFVADVVAAPPAAGEAAGKRLRLYYSAQVGDRPPRIAIQVNDRRLITRDWAYYLENRLREHYGLEGVPLMIDFIPKAKRAAGGPAAGINAAVRRPSGGGTVAWLRQRLRAVRSLLGDLLFAIGRLLRPLGRLVASAARAVGRLFRGIGSGVRGFWTGLSVATRRRLVAAVAAAVAVSRSSGSPSRRSPVSSREATLPAGRRRRPRSSPPTRSPTSTSTSTPRPSSTSTRSSSPVARRCFAQQIVDQGAGSDPGARGTAATSPRDIAPVARRRGRGRDRRRRPARRRAGAAARGERPRGRGRVRGVDRRPAPRRPRTTAACEIATDERGLATARVEGSSSSGPPTACGRSSTLRPAPRARRRSPTTSSPRASASELPDHRFLEACVSADGAADAGAQAAPGSARSRPSSPGDDQGRGGVSVGRGRLARARHPQRARPRAREVLARFLRRLPALRAEPAGEAARRRRSPTSASASPGSTVDARSSPRPRRRRPGSRGLRRTGRAAARRGDVDIESELLPSLGDEAAFTLGAGAVPGADPAAPGGGAEEAGGPSGVPFPFLEFVAKGVDEEAARAALAALQGPVARRGRHGGEPPGAGVRGGRASTGSRAEPAPLADRRAHLRDLRGARRRRDRARTGSSRSRAGEAASTDARRTRGPPRASPSEPSLLAYFDFAGLLPRRAVETAWPRIRPSALFADDIRRLGGSAGSPSPPRTRVTRHRRPPVARRRRTARASSLPAAMTDQTPARSSEYLFTSESVTEGHPDKIADQISDGVLDAVLTDDPYGRVACETLVNTGLVVVSGEISTDTYVDIQEIARETIRKIGYTDADLGFSADSCAVINAIDKQSPDIAQGVDDGARAAHRPRRRRRARRRRRGRPGNDVRLRDPRDAGADAAADLARAQARPPAGRGPQGRGRPVPAPRRQDPGHRPLRERRPDRDREGPDLHPAPRRRRHRHADPPRPLGARPPPDPARGALRRAQAQHARRTSSSTRPAAS